MIRIINLLNRQNFKRYGLCLIAVLALFFIIGCDLSTPPVSTVTTYLYWVDSVNKTIERSLTDGTGQEVIVPNTGGEFPWDLAINPNTNILYWTDGNYTKRSDIQGNTITTLNNVVDASNTAIALDLNAGHVYWSDTFHFTITRMDLDGSNPIDVTNSFDIDNITAMAIDSAAGKVYYADDGLGDIYMSSLGVFPGTTLLNDIDIMVTDICLDTVNEKMYWAEDDQNAGSIISIKKSDLDGNNPVTLATNLDWVNAMALDVVSGKLYYTDKPGGNTIIYRMNLDGSNVEEVVSTGIGSISRLSICYIE